MAEVRVDRPAYVPPLGVPGASEDRPRHQGDRDGGRERRDTPDSGGREELAVALDEGGRSLRAQFEEGSEGEARVRILDRATGGTIAVLTPDELREMAEQTGLPAGLLFQART